MDSNKDDMASQTGNRPTPTIVNNYNITNSPVAINASAGNHDTTGCSSQPSGDVLPDNSKLSSSPVRRFRQPISDLKETQTYQKILRESENMPILVLHCHGIAGSGKSQMVRKLAKQFPFKENSDLYIKWHIQCNDSGHDVKEELEGLAKELRRNSYLQKDDKYQSIVRDINRDLAGSLADALLHCGVPVLIIIEDPGGGCKKILQDFFRCLQNNSQSEAILHVYVTSRMKSVVLSDYELRDISCVKMEQVKGFSKEEALDYLSPDQDEEDMEAANKVFHRFSGVPLGLQAARAYCKNAQISYSDYLELVEENEYEIQKSERKQTLTDYGENAEHVFQALTLPFQVTDESNNAASLQWKVLSCLSCFHYDRIPEFMIESCFRHLREKVVKRVHLKADKGNLITKLKEHAMCTGTDKKEVTFHEVVINAFRLNAVGMPHDSNFYPLKSAVIIMSGLISKDLRKKENQNKMFQLRRHVQSLLENVEKDHQLLVGEDYFLTALVSHLYETAAAIMLAESPTYGTMSDEYFKKALLKLWGKEKQFSLTHPTQKGNCVEDIAKYVVEQSQRLAGTLPDDFVLKYYSKLPMPVDEEELNFLKSKSSGDFDVVLKSIKLFAESGEVIRKLQECGVFLSDDNLRSLFLAERMASILHSWSRVILYAEDKMAHGDENCMWYSSLSRSISKQCNELSGKSLLSERLATTGGLIPILVKQKKSRKHLLEAIEMCETALSDQSLDALPPMYENGLLKEVDGPSDSSTRLIVLRSLVRSYGRLLKSENLDDKGDKTCEELMKLARSHLDNKSNAIMCLIYCAKYYAGRKNFKKSMDCFKLYFDVCEKCKPRFNVHCWAVYNYTRAAYLGKNEAMLEDAKHKCDEVLKTPDIMSPDLHKKLCGLLDKVRI